MPDKSPSDNRRWVIHNPQQSTLNEAVLGPYEFVKGPNTDEPVEVAPAVEVERLREDYRLACKANTRMGTMRDDAWAEVERLREDRARLLVRLERDGLLKDGLTATDAGRMLDAR